MYYTGKVEEHGHYDFKDGWKFKKCYVFTGQFGGPETYYTEADLERLVER